MPRIKKKGLDYFPINTDFIHDRLVRRIMKREGDAAIAVLLEALSYIYAGEGYYVVADQLFYEDLSANLFEKSTESVIHIIQLAVEYGLFDATLFANHSILTSVEIQRQYLFSTKRRSISQLAPAYCLLAADELAVLQHKKGTKADNNTFENGDEDVTFNPENVTSGTHSTAQNSIAKNSTEKHSVAEQKKEYPLLDSPTGGTGKDSRNDTGKDEVADKEMKEGEERRSKEEKEEISFDKAKAGPPCKRQEWTIEAIEALQPPTDGLTRNYEGLLYNMRLYGIPPSEQYAIARKSNYGVIGGPVWKGFCSLRDSNGKIKLPGRYLLSLLNK